MVSLRDSLYGGSGTRNRMLRLKETEFVTKWGFLLQFSENWMRRLDQAIGETNHHEEYMLYTMRQ